MKGNIFSENTRKPFVKESEENSAGSNVDIG